MPDPNCNAKWPPKIDTLPSFGILEFTLSTSVTTLSTTIGSGGIKIISCC